MALVPVAIERVGAGVVIRPQFDPTPRPFETITDADWERAWESTVLDVLAALRSARADGLRRIVVVVPVLAMSGGANYAHVAAPAEAIRVLAKSAARQWGRDGFTVNVLALAAGEIVDDPAAAGPVSIAPAAIDTADPDAVVRFLCSDAAGDVTGQTITVDGGEWM